VDEAGQEVTENSTVLDVHYLPTVEKIGAHKQRDEKIWRTQTEMKKYGAHNTKLPTINIMDLRL